MARVSKKKKQSVRKVVKKKVVSPKPIGKVTHYFTAIKVAIVKFAKPVKKGTAVRFSGATTDFKQKIGSLQYNHKDIAVAPKGKQVGMKVSKRVREGDVVYLEQ